MKKGTGDGLFCQDIVKGINNLYVQTVSNSFVRLALSGIVTFAAVPPPSQGWITTFRRLL